MWIILFTFFNRFAIATQPRYVHFDPFRIDCLSSPVLVYFISPLLGGAMANNCKCSPNSVPIFSLLYLCFLIRSPHWSLVDIMEYYAHYNTTQIPTIIGANRTLNAWKSCYLLIILWSPHGVFNIETETIQISVQLRYSDYIETIISPN